MNILEIRINSFQRKTQRMAEYYVRSVVIFWHRGIVAAFHELRGKLQGTSRNYLYHVCEYLKPLLHVP